MRGSWAHNLDGFNFKALQMRCFCASAPHVLLHTLRCGSQKPRIFAVFKNQIHVLEGRHKDCKRGLND